MRSEVSRRPVMIDSCSGARRPVTRGAPYCAPTLDRRPRRPLTSSGWLRIVTRPTRSGRPHFEQMLYDRPAPRSRTPMHGLTGRRVPTVATARSSTIGDGSTRRRALRRERRRARMASRRYVRGSREVRAARYEGAFLDRVGRAEGVNWRASLSFPGSPVGGFAKLYALPASEVEGRLERSRARLLSLRARRPQPAATTSPRVERLASGPRRRPPGSCGSRRDCRRRAGEAATRSGARGRRGSRREVSWRACSAGRRLGDRGDVVRPGRAFSRLRNLADVLLALTIAFAAWLRPHGRSPTPFWSRFVDPRVGSSTPRRTTSGW